MSVEFDQLTNSLCDVYAERLNAQQKAELLEALDVLARDAKYNVFNNTFPDEGKLSIHAYARFKEMFDATALHTIVAAISANRTGKSVAGSFITTCHATGIYPSWWNGKRYHKPLMIWVGGDTSLTCRDIIQYKLLGDIGDFGSGMIPKDKIVECKTRRNIPDAIETIRVKHVSGGVSTIVIKTYEQGRAAWQGTEVDFIWIDEECPKEVYGEALIRLMTTKGSILLTFTPLSGLTDLVVDLLDNDQFSDAEFPVYVAKISWWDVPHLDAKAIAQMLAATPENMRAARSLGDPTVGDGLIYPLPPDQVTCDDFKIPKYYPRAYGMDVGWNATAAIFGAWDRDNDIIYIYSEYKQGKADPLIHSSAIRSRGTWMRGTIDPASRMSGQADGKKLFESYSKSLERGGGGLKLVPAVNAVESGIFNVWDRLQSGRLKIFKSCTQLMREYSLYHRKDGKIVKTNDHCFTGDTRVVTNEGIKRIDEVCGVATSILSYHGDFVKTSGSRLTQHNAKLVKVTLSNGYSFKCTPDHKLFSIDGLWYSANISKGVNLFMLGEELWQQKADPNFSKNSTGKHSGSVVTITSATENDCTELCGSIHSEPYQKVLTSIIKMATNRTTQSATLNALSSQNIAVTIQKNLLPKGLLALLRTFNEYKKQQKFGMEATLEETGIESIMRNLNTFFMREWSDSAPFAVNYTTLVSNLRKTLSAVIIANPRGEENLGSILCSEFVKFVETNSTAINITRQRHAHELVVVNAASALEVVSVVPCDNEDVYCFTVPFFESFVLESGIVVHNCLDSLRYLCAADQNLWKHPESEVVRTRSNVIDMAQRMNACI